MCSQKSLPNEVEWRTLYQAATDIKKQAPWRWMGETDIFAVKNPEKNEYAFCSVIGSAEMNPGVVAHLGSEGLDVLLQLLGGELDPFHPETLFSQKCLTATFERRSALPPEDLEVIRHLSLDFGRKQWPFFRSYQPGLLPWPLTAGECRFLTHILHQTLEISVRRQEDKSLLSFSAPMKFFAKIPKKSGDTLVWQDSTVTPHPPKQNLISFGVNDELRIKRFLVSKPVKSGILEADLFYAPTPIRGKGRPYFPQVCLLLDHDNAMIINYQMMRSPNREGYKCIEMLLSLCEQNRILPTKILTVHPETYYLFSTICQQLGIRLELVDQLENMEQAKKEMFDYLTTNVKP